MFSTQSKAEFIILAACHLQMPQIWSRQKFCHFFNVNSISETSGKKENFGKLIPKRARQKICNVVQ